jgi:type II secretory pathway pseudopilin PulG
MAATALAIRKDSRRPSLGLGRGAREAFTLVELLVVIVIIIILMGLLTPVLVQVMARAREARITVEIGTLDMSMKAYKERYGQFPPSDFSAFSSPTGPIALHLAHCFPRCNVATEVTAIPGNLSPSQALVFWLSGFYPDPEHPLTGTGTKTSFFPFDTTRLQTPSSTLAPSTTAVPVYGPADGLNIPYIYFAAQNYATQIGQAGTQGDYCMPYVLDNGPIANPLNPYANPNSCQIISAGLDGNYGTTAARGASGATSLCSFPSGKAPNPSSLYSTFNDGLPDQTAITSGIKAYSQGDLDNLTNFSPGSLKDSQQ